MSFDLNETYKQVEGKIKATTTYKDVRKNYDDAKKLANGSEGEFQEGKEKDEKVAKYQIKASPGSS